MTEKPTPIRDYFLEAHRAAEKHLTALSRELEELDEGFEPEEFEEAAGPFCGCETCVIREVLWAAWPLLRDAALAGVE